MRRRLHQGWNTPYGLIFQFNNIFQSAPVLGNYQGGVGAQYNLGPKSALRGIVTFNRASDSPQIADATVTATTGTTITMTTTKTFTPPAAGYTSTWGIGVGADYLMALSESALMPYVGGGLMLSYGSTALKYKDDITGNQGTPTPPTRTVQTVDNSDSTFGVGVRGLVGAQWRLHDSFAFFAEYALGVGLVNHTSHSGDTRSEMTDVATSTTAVDEMKDTWSKTNYLSAGVGIQQAGQLGLLVFF